MIRIAAGLFFLWIVLNGCVASHSSFNVNKKYSPQQLQKDYIIFRTLLQENHPGTYWYASKDSMDMYFENGAQQLKDSLTEAGFRKVLAYVLAKIDCGHTTVRPSKQFSKYADTVRNLRQFPFTVKIWEDTAVVTTTFRTKDAVVLKRGTPFTAINGHSLKEMTDTMFQFISADGKNLTHKYQTLSNRNGFGAYYTSIFGLQSQYKVDYIDSLGNKQLVTIPLYVPVRDTARRTGIRKIIIPTKKERRRQMLKATRNMTIDSATNTAYMELNSFARGYRLRHFFKTSFETLKHRKIKNLVIDVRGNGGGSVTNSTLLTKYIADAPFKIADTLYAIKKGGKYQHYIKQHFWNNLFIVLFTHKKADGHYHFRYFEKKKFTPKKHLHYNGTSYVVIGGNSFSATTLFASAVKPQQNVIVVGEETGGGAYGNTAWLIPDVVLPETKLIFRLPLFRLVIDNKQPKDGHGVMPEVEVKPTVQAIQNNRDYKMDKVNELIRSHQ